MTARVFFAAVASAALGLFSTAAALDAETWERDAQLVETSVVEAVDQEFESARGREWWQEYHQAFAAGVERFDGIVDDDSLAIMREIAGQLEADFAEFDRRMRWQEASMYVTNKLAYVTYVLRAGVEDRFGVETWMRDAELAQRSVIETIDQEYQRSRDREEWEDYHSGFTDSLDRLTGLVDANSLQIMREVSVQLRQNFAEFRRRQSWQDASFYARNTLALTTFVLSVRN